MPKTLRLALTVLLLQPLTLAQEAATPLPPAPEPRLQYEGSILPGESYDPAVPTIEDLIGIRPGERLATPEEITACFKAWDARSDRATLAHYATSHEGRPLYYMVITSPENTRRLDDIKASLARLADPRDLSQREQDRILRDLPAVAWMAYSIHGDETSGADAALALAYHLTASLDDDTLAMLRDLVVIIDPSMNPDGRARYIKMLREAKGVAPTVDDQSLAHTGPWPAGRGNHYLFDLNRDWIFGVHPETRGRMRAVHEWKPLLFVDSHEMGPQDTFLFSPPREPMNTLFPERRAHWNDLFAREQARAFDQHGWPYYTGEWNEGWYPGYSDAWAAFKGAVGILYEQAGVAPVGIARRGGRVLTYAEAVHAQFESSLANLRTLRENREALQREYIAERRRNTADDSPYAEKSWVIVPDGNTGRLARFTDLMRLHGVEVYEAPESFTADCVDSLGRAHEGREFPAGSLIIPGRQPEAPLAAVLLTFDQRMGDDFLIKERRELLRRGESKLYDITAWNLPMFYGLDAHQIEGALPRAARPYEPSPTEGGVDGRDSSIGWVIDGRDDRSVAAAAQLLDRGVPVRLARRDFTLGQREFPRGSVLITRNDARVLDNDRALEALDEVTQTLGVRAVGVTTGLGEGDLPDMGGEYFVLLEKPRIAILTRDGVDPTDFGAVWHALDQRLGLRTTLLDVRSLGRYDLRRYNTIIAPNMYGDALGDSADALHEWVNSGGTLIAIGSSASSYAGGGRLPGVAALPGALKDIEPFRRDVERELLASVAEKQVEHVWSGSVRASQWTSADLPDLPDEKQLERLDERRALFMPQGAILAARVDDEHWLTSGVQREEMPVIFVGRSVLLSKHPAEAPVRLGLVAPTGSEAAWPAPPSEENGEADAFEAVGWSFVPRGWEARLRVSGLLWPEAAERLLHASYLVRQPVGDGQVILFAAPPAFRGGAEATTRLLLNAVIYGPGAGANPPITP